MITKMNKYAFLIYHKEYDEFLLRLRDLGVVHIKENQSTKGIESFQQILQQRKEIEGMLATFKAIHERMEDKAGLSPARPIAANEYEALFRPLNTLIDNKNKLQSQLTILEKEASYMDNIWGDFNYDILEKIREAGYNMTFFSTPTSEYNEEWESLYNAIPIKSAQSLSYFITITPANELLNLSAEKVKLPESCLSELNICIEQLKKDIEQISREMETHAIEDYNTFIALDNVLQDEFNLSNTKMQSTPEADEKLMLLEGWTPKDKASDMEQALDKAGYLFRKLDITNEDNIPILLRNNRFATLYEPLCKIFDLPNYCEFDPTPFFAPFFMLFFGMCFADAGYGLILLLACTLLKPKVSSNLKPICSLFQFLGGAALLVGALTGSFFGIPLVEVPMLSGIKDYFISSNNMMIISLAVGIIHIIFGKCVAAIKIMTQRGVKYGIAPFAWVFVIISAVLILALPQINIILPATIKKILWGIGGVTLAIALLYNSPGKNIFLNFGSGLWNTYNIASSLLGDTLSYIRLFAIGLTGAILGSAFNSLAIMMTEGMGIIPRIILMAFILIFGHSINFALCTISSLIHPLRLVFVEYYKNAEFEGGGSAYEPFKKI